jgi:hypothetical protein
MPMLIFRSSHNVPLSYRSGINYNLSWGTLVNPVINLQVIYNAENFLTSSGTISFSRQILLQEVSQTRGLLEAGHNKLN